MDSVGEDVTRLAQSRLERLVFSIGKSLSLSISIGESPVAEEVLLTIYLIEDDVDVRQNVGCGVVCPCELHTGAYLELFWPDEFLGSVHCNLDPVCWHLFISCES